MNNRQSLYLLWATILNQSQSAETVLKNTFELFKRLNLLSDFDKEYKNLDYEFITELGFGCFAGKESICIDPLGNVKPCSHYPKEFICGNVKRDNLKYIWNNSQILKQLRELEGNYTCNNCKEYNNCRGGCRYRYFKDGNINGIDPFCYLKNNLLDIKS